MTESSFGRRFHALKYLKLDIFGFFIFLEFIINLKAPSQELVENHQFNVLFHVFHKF
jgi:hypothetical protein